MPDACLGSAAMQKWKQNSVAGAEQRNDLSLVDAL
jgi:hypothetical protein